MPKDAVNQRPIVSVVLATLNEGGYIRKCMTSLLEQETPDFDLEILAVDGLSTDGTREYLERVAAADPRVKVLVNEKKRTPFAFNLGLREAKGEYVCIFGAHAVYQKDYISVCLKALIAKGAGGSGGRVLMEAAGDGLQARLVAETMAHPFGSSRKSFRTQSEGFVDSIGYMVIRKEALIAVGGYSEGLLRNQDNDTNQKLRASGYQLYCTWQTQCFYHTKETIRELLNYAYRNGFWNVISFKENSSSMGARHFIPFFFVLGLLSSLLLAAIGVLSPIPLRVLFVVPFFLILLLHLSAGTIAALQVSIRRKDLGALLLPFVFFGFHFAYGLGTLVAILKGAKIPDSPSSRPAKGQHTRPAIQ
jgi:succinoglycan biosynthesis protein ExoA